MKNKCLRIKIIGDSSYLVYQRGLIFEMSKIEKRYTCTAPIKTAFKDIKDDIRCQKSQLNPPAQFEEREPNHVLKLLAEKRRQFRRECFKSKKPVNRADHVGVEIEFISDSDRDDIARDLTALGLNKFVELKSDGSVSSGNSGDCDGSCREDCTCWDCGEAHYCDDENKCNRARRNYGSIDNDRWEYREDCSDCEETETIDDCDCGGKDDNGEPICKGEHVVCSGHCPGHHCCYKYHEDFDCQCECTCQANYGHEIAIVARRSQIHDIVRKTCEVLQKHGAEVNDTCGLHVHLDMRNVSDVNRSFGNLVKAQKLLYSMCPRSRYNNSYCKPNISLSMERHGGRYWGINPASYSEHQTLEVRIHSGTVNVVKINNWIDLLSRIAYAKSIKKIEKLSDLTSKVKLSEKLVDYIKERVEKFNDQHRNYAVKLDIAPVIPIAAVTETVEHSIAA